MGLRDGLMRYGGSGESRGAARLAASRGNCGQTHQRFVDDVLAAPVAADRQRVGERGGGGVKFVEKQPRKALIASQVEDETGIVELAGGIETCVEPLERLAVSALNDGEVSLGRFWARLKSEAYR